MTDDNFTGSRRDGYTPTPLPAIIARVRRGHAITNAEAGALVAEIERSEQKASDAELRVRQLAMEMLLQLAPMRPQMDRVTWEAFEELRGALEAR